MHDERLRCGWHIPCRLGASRSFLSFAFHGPRSHPRTGSWLLEGTPRIRRVVASPNIDRVCRLFRVRCIRGVCFHVVVAHVPTSATSLFGFFCSRVVSTCVPSTCSHSPSRGVLGFGWTDAPHIFIGASSSRRLGCDMKTSLAARHSFRISPSASCTCFPGLPFRTSNSRLMRSSITASSCSLRPSRFRTCLASACVLTPSTTRPKHTSHRTCVSSTFPFHSLFFFTVPRNPLRSPRRFAGRAFAFVPGPSHASFPSLRRACHAPSLSSAARAPRTRRRYERDTRPPSSTRTQADTPTRWHLHPRAHGAGATPTPSPGLCRGSRYTPSRPVLPGRSRCTPFRSQLVPRADTPLLARWLALPSRYTPFASLSGRRRSSRETETGCEEKGPSFPALFFHGCDAWLQVNRMQGLLDQGHARGWNVSSPWTGRISG